MNWFDKLFGEDDNDKSTRRLSHKRSHHQSDIKPANSLIPQSHDVYQRPRGKFRFPIDMHDESDKVDVHGKQGVVTTDTDSKNDYKEVRPSYTLNRSQRRHRNNVHVKEKNNETSSAYEKRDRQLSSQSYHRYQTPIYRATGEREQSRPTFDDVKPTYHKADFKASEVPSAIFGTKARREIPNSGLNSPTRSQAFTSKRDKHEISSAETPLQQSKQKRQETPNYSKKDNTINIENIYASQIVEEIRREREKKVLQKKRFKAALQQKRDTARTEGNNTIQQAIDKMYAEQAKQLLGDTYHEEQQVESSYSEQDTSPSNEQLQEAVTDDYQYEEVDLAQYTNDANDTEEATYRSTEDELHKSDIGEITSKTSSDEQLAVQTSDYSEQVPLDAEENSDNSNRSNVEGLQETDQHEKGTVVERPVLKPTVTSNHTKEMMLNDTNISDEQQTESTNSDQQALQSAQNVNEPIDTVSKDKHTPSSALKASRLGTRPFNVVMTPSDKKRHLERQQRRANNQRDIQEAQYQPSNVEAQTQARGSEIVTSPELVATEEQTQQQTEASITEKGIRRGPSLHLPSVDLLDEPEVHKRDDAWIEEKKQELNDAFYYFNVPAEVVNVIEGPSVTRFELSVEKGVKVSRITALQDDIKMALAAKDIRIEAPIPGTSLVGIEVPNQQPTKVNLRSIIDTPAFKNASSKLTVAMGNRINNEPLLMDIAKTPHALIAGATGSGKSVSINSILISLLYRNHPEELKLLLIDPKMVELAPYNDLPHLVAPVITDVKAATQSLKWAVDEMERRYKLFAQTHVRNITAFNKKVSYEQRIPKIVIVIDELADLMMMAPQDVEQSIARLAQKARACGIHMLVATQRPSVNVITGLIKANIPTRIAFMVSSSVDSRTILDSGGAERLLGYGDMLYLGGGMNKPIRVQGTFVSDDEIDHVVDFIKAQREPEYLFKEQELLKKTETPAKDELFYEVCHFMIREQSISTSLIQRHFQIGYNRAARIIDQLEQLGYISGANGSKPRDVYLTEAELSEL
ncbi:DNA translocase FtsK [Staphylococcus sp. 17KM0847]|uniref:DNA translocase FtsK n=1 Tax=Staphylococcus sp. 17KM0847 TaxID=2583989 RepID=UPI0015DC9BF9|nr:DNA translocase FtsK [Staphylococcus sp. 17KM0847]QLK86277.1 DNA translocase FtsK [Staphylococcus sp. 17KM0847]